MLNLMKKDFLIVKKMSCIILGLSLIIPIFFNFITEEVSLPFVVVNTSMVLILGIMFFSSIYEEEEKFPKSKSLISTIGYTRKTQIKEKYVLAAVVFFYITLVVTIESMLLSNLNLITMEGLAISFLVFTVIYGLFFFLTTKYGIRAGRYINVFVILLMSLGPMMVEKLNIDFGKLQNINEKTLIALSLALGAVVYLCTYIASVRIYEAKDL